MMRFLQIWALFFGLMILTVTCPSRLQAVDVAPIVDQGWLLGGFSQGKWLISRGHGQSAQGGRNLSAMHRDPPPGKGAGQ